MLEGVMLTGEEWRMFATVMLLTFLFPTSAVVGWYSGKLDAWRECRRRARRAGLQIDEGLRYVDGRRR